VLSKAVKACPVIRSSLQDSLHDVQSKRLEAVETYPKTGAWVMAEDMLCEGVYLLIESGKVM
jgi:hypothetical protein